MPWSCSEVGAPAHRWCCVFDSLPQQRIANAENFHRSTLIHSTEDNGGVAVNKFESTPVFSSNSGLNLASSYLQQGANARTATSIRPTKEKNSSCSQAYASSITINLFSTAHSPAIPWDLGILHSSPNFETEILVRFHFEQSNRISYIRIHNRNTCGFHLFKKDFWASWLDWLFCYPNRRHGSVLISISESVAIESSSSALHHCRVISIIHGPLVNVRVNVHIYIYIYMILILQQFWHFPLALTPTMFLRFYLEQILQWCWIKRIFQ